MQTIILKIKAYVWWILFREIIIITEDERDSWRKAVDIKNMICATQERILARIPVSTDTRVHEMINIEGHDIKMVGYRKNGSIKYHWEF